MSVAIGLRFPLGEYHATRWDRAVNSGESEWPPSPWRILRALLSTWHTRCPDIVEDEVVRLIRSLSSEAPSFRVPPTLPSHTRHYLPGAGHTQLHRDTSYTLAPRLQVDPGAEVVVLWAGVDLDAEQRHVLARLIEHLPYLGRAESICEARVLAADETASPDASWTVPSDGAGDTRVLCPEPGVTRAQLEVSPDGMRKARRLTPEGAVWREYRQGATEAIPRREHRAELEPIHCARWSIAGPVAIRERDGVLATSGLRASVLSLVKARKLDTHDQTWVLAGEHDARRPGTDHRHAHWFWLSDGDAMGRRETAGESQKPGPVTDLVLWVPDAGGIPEEFLPAVIGVRSLARLRESLKGYVPAALHLQALGSVADVFPEGYAVSARWQSSTPMLTDRHPKKRKDPAVFIRREIERELAFRPWGGVAPQVVSVQVQSTWLSDPGGRSGVQGYRRYRLGESMAQRRLGFRVIFEVDRPIPGPVSLGALSHFGFGRFSAI